MTCRFSDLGRSLTGHLHPGSEAGGCSLTVGANKNRGMAAVCCLMGLGSVLGVLVSGMDKLHPHRT